MKTFLAATIIVLVGLVAMVFGEAWNLSSSSDYVAADSDWIAAYESGDSDAYMQALWDMHNAQNSGILASAVLNLGLIVVAMGIAMIAYGLHERESPAPPRPTYYPAPAPGYPVGWPPPGYQYPPSQPQYPPPQPP